MKMTDKEKRNRAKTGAWRRGGCGRNAPKTLNSITRSTRRKA